MPTSLAVLKKAQEALNALDAERANDNDQPLHCNDFRSRLLVADGGNGLHVQYDGEVWEDAFEIALKAICKAAPDIVSLKFMGPDEGANGCRTHDFSALLATKAVFPNLVELVIRQTNVTDHNTVEVEDEQITPLIKRCPALTSLTLPQAPTPDFFKLALTSLTLLNIGMHWQTHRFIQNLAGSSNMPNLMVLCFSDSLSIFEEQDEAENREEGQRPEGDSQYGDSATSFADYCALFQSKRLPKRAIFHLRNALLSVDEFKKLESMRPDLQFSASLETPHVYVSHWAEKFNQPFRHLVLPQRRQIR